MNGIVRKRIAIVIGFAAVAAVASQVLFAQPKPNHSAISTTLLASLAPPALVSASPASGATSTQPKITWSTTSISVILSPGESTSSSLTFTSSQKLSSASLSVVPQIASFVTVQPNSIANVAANQAQSVQLLFSIPTAAALGTYDGTLQLKSGTTTFPQTVKVIVNVWPRVTDAQLGISLQYPPSLFVVRPNERPDELLIQSSASRINLGGFLPEGSTETLSGFIIGVSRRGYPKTFTLTQWLLDTYPYSTVATSSVISISGIQSYRITFQEEIGAGEPTLVIPTGGDVIEITYASTFDPSSIEDQNGMAIYNKVLQTVHVQ